MSAYYTDDIVLNEIRDIKEKVIASQQVSFLREAEREHWQKLVDSNIRSGTLACMWCLKAQYVKKLSVAFNKWRLVSALKAVGSRTRKPATEDTPRKAASAAVQNALQVMNRLKPTSRTATGTSTAAAAAAAASSASSAATAYLESAPVQFPWEVRRFNEAERTSRRDPPEPSPALSTPNKDSRDNSFAQLTNALLDTHTDAETKRQMLLDMSHSILSRSGTRPRDSRTNAFLPPAPPSPRGLDRDEDGVRESKEWRDDLAPGLSPVSLSSSFASTRRSGAAAASHFSHPRASGEDWQHVLRVRHGVGGDVVRATLSTASPAPPPPPPPSTSGMPRYLLPTGAFLKKTASPEDKQKVRRQAAGQQASRRASWTSPAAGGKPGPRRMSTPAPHDDPDPGDDDDDAGPAPPHRQAAGRQTHPAGTAARRPQRRMTVAQERLLYGELQGRDSPGWSQSLRR